ncbi:MAG: hypothetical protein QM756_18545 [Polyangiaceae bacterium]
MRARQALGAGALLCVGSLVAGACGGSAFTGSNSGGSAGVGGAHGGSLSSGGSASLGGSGGAAGAATLGGAGNGGSGTAGSSVGMGGAQAGGGSTTAGGAPASGGSAGSGGASSGGALSSGGGRGGASSGGGSAKGGGLGSGGALGTGGVTAAGGSSSGGTASGGAAAGGSSSGGAAAGGAASGGATSVGGGLCTTNSDCQLSSDCCNCSAIGPGETVAPCKLLCIQSACAAKSITSDEVRCVSGRCVLARSCNLSAVACDALPPTCAAGQVPSVLGGCYGPCIPVGECSEVNSCNDCAANGLVCVTDDSQLGPIRHCVNVPSACNGQPTCACMAACMRPYTCASASSSAVSCICPTC